MERLPNGIMDDQGVIFFILASETDLVLCGQHISDIVSNKLTGMHNSLPGGPMMQIM